MVLYQDSKSIPLTPRRSGTINLWPTIGLALMMASTMVMIKALSWLLS